MAINFTDIKTKMNLSWQDPLFIWSTRISFISIGLTLLLLIFTWKQLPPQLPLFYSLPWGEEQLTNPFSFGIFLGLTLVIYCFLSISILLIRSVSRLYAQILTISATVLVLMSVYAIIRIILLII